MENNNVFGFNVADAEDEKGYELLAPGDYEAMISSAEMKAPKNGGADYLQIEYTLTDHNDRKVWDILSINSSNSTAQNIARSRLKSICLACDLELSAVNNPDQLLHRSLSVTLGIQKDKTGQYSDKNIVKKVSALYEKEEIDYKKVDSDKIPF